MEISNLMSQTINKELSEAFEVSQSTIENYEKVYRQIIAPKIKEKYLSHLIMTIEELINDKRIKPIIEAAKSAGADSSKEIQLL
jgi:predicted transcriptional regulator